MWHGRKMLKAVKNYNTGNIVAVLDLNIFTPSKYEKRNIAKCRKIVVSKYLLTMATIFWQNGSPPPPPKLKIVIEINMSSFKVKSWICATGIWLYIQDMSQRQNAECFVLRSESPRKGVVPGLIDWHTKLPLSTVTGQHKYSRLQLTYHTHYRSIDDARLGLLCHLRINPPSFNL